VSIYLAFIAHRSPFTIELILLFEQWCAFSIGRVQSS
jgi:hypothetical protein